MKRILLLLLALCLALSLFSCDGDENVENGESAQSSADFAKFEMADGATFVVELYPEYAPETVENFKKLVSQGFYDGLTFHRIYKGFMIQGGCPKGDGTGSSEQKIRGEFSSNGFTQNTLKHERGVISMARGNNPDSASCQFFIMHQNAEHLDGNYAAFGRVVEGMDVIDAIAETQVTYQSYSMELSKPIEPPVIKTVTLISYSAK